MGASTRSTRTAPRAFSSLDGPLKPTRTRSSASLSASLSAPLIAFLIRYAQAREDALECIKLDPKFAKGHFRLALALQAEEDPAGACAAFTKALALEPGNKEAAAGLNVARMQAERMRRMEAGEIS